MYKLLPILAFVLGAVGPVCSQQILCGAELCASGKQHFHAPRPMVLTADLRSDSVDIVRTDVTLDITDFAGQTIRGEARLHVLAQMPDVQTIRFDLLDLTVDSVTCQLAEVQSWSRVGESVVVTFEEPLQQFSSCVLTLYYGGSPVKDASGWGGFYWQNGYAYNLGVGFAADPHSYGRAWFPCFDNFVERSLYTFTITSPAGKPSFCNGQLIDNQVLPNGDLRRTWEIQQAIPSYLAGVAVGPYVNWERTFAGASGPVPVQVAVAAGDSVKLSNSFTHLSDALDCYEYWYGPYRWNKIGYSVVPFSSGAMEHATNIAYMRPAVDGTLGFETLMAHELSHHWWGNLATCSTEEDMWLNEGWASFSQYLFLEWVYGEDTYRSTVETEFLQVLQQTHLQEGYRAVSGVPHNLTYGDHVYKKGAIVAYNLRGYLGDSLFRVGIRSALDQTQMDDWSSAELRDKMTAATGVDLTYFFEDQVFSPGFMDFVIDSVVWVTPAVDTFYIAQIHVQQKPRGLDHYYQQVPLEFTFLRADGTREYRTATVSGLHSVASFNFPITPNPIVRIWANTRQRIMQARGQQERTIATAGTHNFPKARMELKADVVPDTTLLRIEHHYAMPDTGAAINPNGYTLSSRFWVVDGVLPDGFDATATILYDGRGQLDQLDRLLFEATSPKEDSVRLLYRAHAGQPWEEYSDYTKNMLGNTQDRFGQIKIMHLQRGQYTIGKGIGTSSVSAPVEAIANLRVAPNPVSDQLRIEADESIANILIFNELGQLVVEMSDLNQPTVTCAAADWTSGMYYVLATDIKGRSGVVSFLKK
jgi:Peptidase family M1 domain/Peptidase M1 N-terminal domain